MKKIRKKMRFAVCTIAAAFLVALPVSAQQGSSSQSVTTLNIAVVPFAALEFSDPNPLLFLEVPPPGSTVPSEGVNFVVIGNSSATLSAEPDSFMQVSSTQFFGIPFDPFLGRAVQAGQEIGYDIELRFPIFPQSARGLPLSVAGPAVSPRVNIVNYGGQVSGTLHLIANPNWTASGGLALPGLYEGEIILTLAAD